MAGIVVKGVTECLGHASVSFTLDTYAHVMPGQHADVAAAAAARGQREHKNEPRAMTDDREELRTRLREEQPLRDASVVLRGGPDTVTLLRSHARRLHRLYVLDGAQVFGVSVFIASGDIGPSSERTILSKKLQSYPTIYRTTVGDLLDASFDVLPTFAAPHYTVVIPHLDAVVALAAAFGNLVRNPYAGA